MLEPERLQPTWGRLTRHPRGWQFQGDDGRIYTTMPLWDRARDLSERRVPAWVHPRRRIAVIEVEDWLDRPRPPTPPEIDRALDPFRASFR